MHRYILLILILSAHTTLAQKTDLEGRNLSGRVKVYKQVTHDVHSFTYGVNSASTDSLFSYYDKKGMLIKYVGYRKSCWVQNGDTSHREFTMYISDYNNDSRTRRTDTGYTYDFINHDTDRHSHVYHMDENGRITVEESNFWFSNGYIVHTIERTILKDGKPDSIIVYTERKDREPEIDMIKKFTYGTLTDTMMAYRISDVKLVMKVVVMNSPTGRREMITKYNVDDKYTESTEFYLYSDDNKEPEYKELMAQKNDHRNGDIIFTTKWNKDKQGNYLRTTTHKEGTLNETYYEIEYYK